MFDQTPIQERHAATGMFAAIGLAGLGAVYLLITGGFAPIAPRIERTQSQDAAFVEVLDSDWAPVAAARITPTSYTLEADDRFYETTGQELVGSTDGAPVRDDFARSYEDVERDIEALYEASYVEASYVEASYVEASYVEEAETVASADDAPRKDEAANAYESASPW